MVEHLQADSAGRKGAFSRLQENKPVDIYRKKVSWNSVVGMPHINHLWELIVTQNVLRLR